MKSLKVHVAMVIAVEGQVPVTRVLDGDQECGTLSSLDLQAARAVQTVLLLVPPGTAPECPVVQLRPRSEWSEEDGPVVWYKVPIEEPPWCGTPNDSDWPEDERMLPYTHWHALPKVVV